MSVFSKIFKSKEKNEMPDTTQYRYVCKCDDIVDITEIHIGACFRVSVSEEINDVIVLVDQKYKDNLIISLSDERQNPSYNKGKLTVNMSGTTVFTGYETAKVILPKSKLNLKKVELSGSASMVGGHFNAIVTYITTSGSSEYNGTVNSKQLMVYSSGSSRAAINGDGDSAVVESSGSSSVYMYNFNAKAVRVIASGASLTTVKASSTIIARASGASDITIYGNPSSRDVRTSGAARIKDN